MTQAKEPSGRLLAGRYRLNAVLGRGGMGTVWRAEDEMLGRIVAVKELRMTGAVDEEEKHRLIVRTLREAKATARIRHTAAVTVFDVVEEDERPWIVMELVESRSLAEVIKEDGPVAPARAAEIALDLLGVLDAAHAHGILHRDVKPSNVLIGEDGRTVLTDFGIASVEGDASITSTGMLVGAPSYISPERARGQKPGPPADLWSLGGTLYSMVEGKPPYDRGSALATLTAVMTEDLTPPANAGALRPVIEGLLKKDPAMRLDAGTTRAMLKRIVADASARAEATTQQAVPAPAADTPSTDAPSAVAPKRGLLGTVRVGSRSAEPAAAPVPPPAPASEPEPPTTLIAPAAGPDRRKVLLGGAALLVVLLLIGVAVVMLRGGGSPSTSADSAHSRAASSAPASPTPTLSPAQSSAAAQSPSAAQSAAPPPSTAAPTTPGVPAGYTAYRDASGFTITLPAWLQDAGAGTDRHTFKGNGSTLVVEWTNQPGPSALKAWQDDEQTDHFTDYHRLNLAPAPFRGWTNSADWEWLYAGSGTTLHALNRGFVTGKYGYAIYWTTPDADWNAAGNVQARQTAFDTFQPAP